MFRLVSKKLFKSYLGCPAVRFPRILKTCYVMHAKNVLPSIHVVFFYSLKWIFLQCIFDAFCYKLMTKTKFEKGVKYHPFVTLNEALVSLLL